MSSGEGGVERVIQAFEFREIFLGFRRFALSRTNPVDHRRVAMPVFAPPELDTKQVVKVLADLGVEIEEKHILTPTGEVTWYLYETLAQNMLRVTREVLQQPAFGVLCKLEYPEMHEQSVSALASWRIIQELLNASGVTDFTLRDLIKPECRRTIRNLSHVINYGRFMAEREDKLDAVQNVDVLQRRQEVEEDIEKLKAQLDAINQEREAQAPAVEAIEAEASILFEEVKALNKEQGSYQKDIQVLKQELTTLNNGISGQKYKLQQAKQEESDLQKRIVPDPEKLQRTIEEQKTLLENTELAVEEARQSVKKLEKKHEALVKAAKKVQKEMGRFEEAQKLLMEEKAKMKEVKAARGKLKATEEEDKQQSKRLTEFKSKGDKLQELIDSAERVGLAKVHEEEKALKDSKERLAQMIQYQKEVDHPRKEAKVQYLLSEIDEVVKTKDEVLKEYYEEKKRLQQKVLGYYRLRSFSTLFVRFSGSGLMYIA
ncbi:hypothetical protein R1flu_005590 [Riccia fluitans]|uniref:Kinetochore protein Nuf2 N-terminal domain-containing protein n=1 Tax=Riccia fluitans TaxID=41844 RepID=A0ABD1YTL5_9MARC